MGLGRDQAGVVALVGGQDQVIRGSLWGLTSFCRSVATDRPWKGHLWPTYVFCFASINVFSN